MNETEGVLGNAEQETPCNIAKKYLMDLIIGTSQLDELVEKLQEETKGDDENMT